MGLNFSYVTYASKVYFGNGSVAHLTDAAGLLGCQKLLVLSTPGQKEAARLFADRFADLCVGIHSEARMHTPVSVTEAAVEVVARQEIDGVVSLGGGSAIGLGYWNPRKLVRSEIRKLIENAYFGREPLS